VKLANTVGSRYTAANLSIIDATGTAKLVGDLPDRVAHDKEGDCYGNVKRVGENLLNISSEK
jgi:hypothetical protein